MVLEFLLRNAARTGSQQALDMVAGSCEAMARGGMYDQLSGGFARYSVDRFWRVPHFEKMLYDNALLLRVYLHWWRQTDSPLAERIARETGRFLLDELRTPEGGFASALDADSDGHEGTFYVWNPNQLMRVLGAEDGAWAAQLLGVTRHRARSSAASRRCSSGSTQTTRTAGRAYGRRSSSARAERTRPARDDKVVASWNGLAITALAEAGVLLDEPDFADAAIAAAAAAGGRAPRRHGSRARPATASPAPTPRCWRITVPSPRRSSRSSASPATRSGSTGRGCCSTGSSTTSPIPTAASSTPRTTPRPSSYGPKDASDNAYPSGTSAAVAALIAFAADHRRASLSRRRGVRHRLGADIATQVPRFAGWTLAAAEAVIAGPLEIAVVGAREERSRTCTGPRCR